MELHDTAPGLDTDGWDEVVEFTLHTGTGQLHVGELEGWGPPDVPNPAFDGPGAYRIRVHAVGRDTNPDGVAEEPLERYLLQVWPAADAAADPARDYKLTDLVGRARRAAAPPTDPAARTLPPLQIPMSGGPPGDPEHLPVPPFLSTSVEDK